MKFFHAPVSLLLLLVPSFAHAGKACYLDGDLRSDAAFDTVHALPAEIVIPRSAKVGDIVLDRPAPYYPRFNATGWCPGWAYPVDAITADWRPSPVAGVYETGVPGIGFRVFGAAGATQPRPLPALPMVRGWFGGYHDTYFDEYWDSFGFQLVIVGKVVPGVLRFPEPVAAAWASTSDRALRQAVKFSQLRIAGTARIVVEPTR